MRFLTPVLAAAALGAAVWQLPALAAEKSVVAPAPAYNAPAGDTAILAGGCFWGVQGVFQHVKGVTSAVSGYAGGDRAGANYRTVGSGNTAHAESVRITYDPKQVSYAKLLQIYFSVVADPTQLNRQGPDTGAQYRSQIFPQNPAQAEIARRYIAQLTAAKVYPKPIVTRVAPDRGFFAAEGYHQNYLTLHPDEPYIAYNDIPKVRDLQKLFPAQWRATPVLVGKRGA
jgi:peptide-methionine (S)-S-oxide reductase